MRDVSTHSTSLRARLSLDMTERLFATLHIYNDPLPRSAAINMAIDEALFQSARVPSIRFYRWNSPALSFGYFGRFTDVANYELERDLVRRWTGGGIVFHGDDLTYSIVIPATDATFRESSMSIYEKVHRALSDALAANGQRAALVEGGDAALRRSEPEWHLRTAQRAVPTDACFANPVHADVLVDGRKVAGAAQRRTRAGLLHQGSIQNVDVANGLAERFAKELSDKHSEKFLTGIVIERAREIAAQKYETAEWLRRR
jgi:lipoyl(octanoyl) transferase